MNPVTDKKLISMLESSSNGQIDAMPVSNPSLIDQLNSLENQRLLSTNKGMLSKASDAAQKYIIDPVQASRLPELGGGILQGAYNVSKSIGDIPLGLLSKLLGKDVSIPALDLEKYGRTDPLSKAAFLGGQIGGSIFPAAKTYQLAESVLGAPTMLKRAAAGALAGAATGEQPDSEHGRLVSALVGGAIPIATSATASSLGKRILNRKKELSSNFKNSYNSLFDELEKKGLGKESLRVPSKLTSPASGEELSLIKTSAPREYTRSLDVFKKNPTFENAHKAQSDLGKLSRYLSTQQKTRLMQGKETGSSKQLASDLAESLQKRIRGSMQNFLISNKQPETLKQYQNLTNKYAREYTPYLHSSIAKYEAGKITPGKMLEALNKSDKFLESQAAKELPGLGLRKALSSKPVLIGGAAITAPLLYKLGLSGLGKATQQAEEIIK